MDLTSGITQMQSQLKPDAFAGYQQGANAYATAQKHGQDIAAKQIENEKAKREQDIQIRLQKAIEESYDEATGQPDYDKLAANGHKYGITAQQMDYAIKHLKDNWAGISEMAKNKRDLELYNPKGSNDVQKAATGSTGWNAESTKTPTAPAVEDTTSKGVAAPTSVKAPAEAISPEAQQALNGASKNAWSINGVSQPVQVARPEIAGEPPAPPAEVDPFAADPTDEEKAKAQAEFDANFAATNGTDPNKPMDLGQTTLTANVDNTQAPHTLYGVANAMKAEPFPTPGAAKVAPYTEDSVKAMSGDWKAEMVRGLRNSGVQLPADAQVTDKMISDGINTITNNAVSSLYKGYNPYDPQKAIGSLYEAEALAPETAQKAFQDLLAKGREVKTTRLGQASTIQSTAQSKTTFDQAQNEIADAKARGFSKVNAGNISEFREADAKYKQLDNTRTEIGQLAAESPKLSDDQFNAKFEGMLIGPKSAEGINTVAGTSRFMEALRKDKSYGQMFHEATGLKDVVAILAKNRISSQGRATILNIMDGVVESQMKTGVAKSKLDSFKPWNKKKMTDGKEGAIVERKPGESRAAYIARGGK